MADLVGAGLTGFTAGFTGWGRGFVEGEGLAGLTGFTAGFTGWGRGFAEEDGLAGPEIPGVLAILTSERFLGWVD